MPASSIGDWSNAGVRGGIPHYPVGANVLDYGATGDGTTDDTDAILDAIEACPESQGVFFPPGYYIITNTLTIDKSISIRGDDPITTHIISRHSLLLMSIRIGQE